MLDSIGRYQIERELSQGERGSTIVYQVVDQDRGRKLALKLIQPEWIEGVDPGEILARMRAAAEGVLRLNHDHIAKVRDLGIVEGMCFACTDFVDGRSAYDWLQERGPFPLSFALRVGLDLLQALEHAAEEGVVHGDVKLENVMIDQEGRSILTDFGMLEDFFPRKTHPADSWAPRMPGLAPEILRGEPPTPLGDLYGVGVVLFELLTGEAAFPFEEGEDPYDVALRRVESPPPIPSHYRDDLPLDLDPLVQALLARDPGARFDSAGDARRALIGLSVDLGIELPSSLPPELLGSNFDAVRERELAGVAEKKARTVSSPDRRVEGTRRASQTRRRQAFLQGTFLATLLMGGIFWVLNRTSYVSLATWHPQGTFVLQGKGKEIRLGGPVVSFRSVPAGTHRLLLRVGSEQEVSLGTYRLDARTHLELTVGDLAVGTQSRAVNSRRTLLRIRSPF